MKVKWNRVAIHIGIVILMLCSTWPARAQGIDYPVIQPLPSPRPFYRFNFGFQSELASRDVDEDAFVFNGFNFPKTKGRADMVRLLARFGVYLLDNVEIYGVAGGSDLSIDEFDQFNSGQEFAYGGGVNWVFYEIQSFEGPIKLYIDYRYFHFRSKDQVLFRPCCDNSGFLIADELVDETITWNEHRLKVGVSGRHYIFEPYGGARFSVVNGKDHLPTSTQDLNLKFKQDDLFGLFFGANIYFDPSDRAFFFIEGSLIDEDALNLGVRVRF